jgi:hypothetical protein
MACDFEVGGHRDPTRITHTLADMIRARVFAICCGYEDADDLDFLRTDPAFKLACGRLPDTGSDLCSQPTLSRLENAPGLKDVFRLTYALVDAWLDSYEREPASVTLDIDDTCDVAHGQQQLSLFNAHYDERCFLPIHVYDTDRSRPVAVVLRPGKTPGGVEVPVIEAFERLFRERGLPGAIRSDNGVPFASPNGLFNLSKLSVWWLRLGVSIERIKPGRPQQNGRHERMHLTLKKEATRPPGMNFMRQQARFDDFLCEFNVERPHEALDMKRPAEVYAPSAKPYDGLPDLSYPLHDRDVLVSPPADASACTESGSTSQACSPASASESRKSTKAFGSSVL